MKVKLAVQVMSKTVSSALKRHYGNGEADETAKLCEYERKQNELLALYRSPNDPRFQLLENVFLK